ncbi:capsule biosynthesis protein [Roseomonas sp. ROY-5-3]|uniref:Capsule biosynthesis protein n=1 Tax=Falsiroseomonas oleicola TaxID=2801474 RepID=A0ABS6H3K3_9PROT|nr:capsule biosynthesis protein [Roseomonas oleicola]
MKLSPPIRPSEAATTSGPGALPRAQVRPRRSILARLKPRGPLGWYILLVLLPTLVVGLYYATYASDMYEAEARILVRGRPGASGGGGAGGIASILGASAGSMRPGGEEAQAVTSFVDSISAVTALQEQLDLAAIWRRPEADRVSRLMYEDPEAERLLSYYRRRVSVDYDMETSIITLKVQAYRPDDATAIAEALLTMSEGLVNRFSARTSQDTLRVGREEVAIAEERVVAARAALTAFREREQTLDPTAAVGSAVQTVARLEGALAQTRAELQEKQAFMRPDNPQIQVLNNRIAALQAQIASERSRRTSGSETLTQQLSGYERLQLEREFAERVYSSAIGSLEAARADAQRQQVFLMRVVEPNLPERATFPKAMFNTMTLLVALTVLYAIGWLVIAGAREHAS